MNAGSKNSYFPFNMVFTYFYEQMTSVAPTAASPLQILLPQLICFALNRSIIRNETEEDLRDRVTELAYRVDELKLKLVQTTDQNQKLQDEVSSLNNNISITQENSNSQQVCKKIISRIGVSYCQNINAHIRGMFLSKYRFEIILLQTVSCTCTLYTYIYWQVTAAITAIFELVYIHLYIFEMPLLIENPANCEICSVIYFSAKSVKAVEIHCNICEVYGQNIMSNGMVHDLHLKNNLGGQCHDDDNSVKTTVLQWLSHQAVDFYYESVKNLLFNMISALILEKIMWKSRLKCGLSCKSKIVTIFLLVFLIPQNGSYLKKNMPRM